MRNCQCANHLMISACQTRRAPAGQTMRKSAPVIGSRRVWQAEIIKWFAHWQFRICLVEPGYDLAAIQARMRNIIHPLIMIVSYDELSNKRSPIAKELAYHGWDLLVCDEAHYLKNPSNRTRALYGRKPGEGIQARAKRVILLSGTPAPNHAVELYQHCRTFWPHACPGNGGLDAFERTYTKYRDTVFGRQITGSQNQAQLRDKLHDVVLRRRKKDVLTELPPLILQDVPLNDAFALKGEPGAFIAASKLGRLTHADDDTFLRALQAPDDAPLASLRRQLGHEKVIPTIEWLQERLQSVSKILVFAWHLDVINHLLYQLGEFKPVVITGETSPKDRAVAVEQFQTDPHCRVFLGQILAAGTAITLTAASEVAIVEPSWVPGENVQAIARAHRMGQRDSVLASFLYLPGTLDQRIMQVFRRKAGEIAQLTGDFDGTENRPRP